MNTKTAEWILRVAVFGEFVGHGVFALQGRESWVGWIQELTGLALEPAAQLLTFVGVMDIVVGFIVLFFPIRAIVLWAAVWGGWTALMRPLVGEPIWDFVERWANWGAPLALLFLQGLPKNIKGWWRVR